MLILLPPSEGKAAARSGRPLRLESLALPALGEARSAVLDALVGLCSGDEDKALEVLGLGEGLRGEVARNAALPTAPAMPAERVYTGVLYDALGLATLDQAARRRARRSLLVFSGLWGAVRVGDRIPAYRCPIGVRLPGVGPLAAHWRGPMREAMAEATASPAGRRLVLDLRSAAYGAAWRPAGRVAERTVTVRVLQVTVVGGVERRSVVSHFNKATKGRLARDLLTAGAEPRSPGGLAGLLGELGYAVEPRPPLRPGTPWQLDVLVREV